MKIAFITVCTDDYPMEYARKIIKRFTELTEFDVNAYCITDRPDEISDIATPVEPPFKKKGWWNKMKVYDSFCEEDFALYLDIDTVLIKNFDKDIERAVKSLDKYKNAVVSDAILWKNNKYSSSMMVLKKGNMQDVWDVFERDSWRLFDYDGGDQVWTGRLLKDSKIFYMDEKNKNIKLNLKFHLGEKIFGQWKFPTYLPSSCKIVDCGGRPKPHDLEHLNYIKENWHNV